MSIRTGPQRRDGDGPDRRDRSERTETMSQYLVLIYEDEAAFSSPEVWEKIGAEHAAFGEAHGKSIVGGNGLQPTPTATSIRSDGKGDYVVTDGPFAETKEALGGYYLIEAADLDEAIALAKAIPANFGGVEVRPVMVLE
jgi:hypothetical protein